MKKKSVLFFQCLWTFDLTFKVYRFFALLDSEGGIEGIFGLLFVQPVWAVLFSIITIPVCLLVGLPIRLNKNLNKWWAKNNFISIAGIILGLALLILAFIPQFAETVKIHENGLETLKEIPNSSLAYTGWFLSAFIALHFFPRSWEKDAVM